MNENQPNQTKKKSTMDPTVKALAFVKRVTASTVANAPSVEDKLMLIDLWERELMKVRQSLVVPPPVGSVGVGPIGNNALLRDERVGFGGDVGKQ